MLALFHMDWDGTDERLKAYEESWKKACEKTEGVEYLGRYKPLNKKYHYTFVTKAKDIPTWYEATENVEWEGEEITNAELTHSELEFYRGPQ